MEKTAVTGLKDKPTSLRDLRYFGWIVGVGLLLVFDGIPALRGKTPFLAPAAIGALLILFGFAYPKILFYPFQIWSLLGKKMGYVNSRIILTVIFFGFLTPYGLLLRVFRKSSMRKGFDPHLSTYRIQVIEAALPHSVTMRRPF